MMLTTINGNLRGPTSNQRFPVAQSVSKLEFCFLPTRRMSFAGKRGLRVRMKARGGPPEYRLTLWELVKT